MVDDGNAAAAAEGGGGDIYASVSGHFGQFSAIQQEFARAQAAAKVQSALNASLPTVDELEEEEVGRRGGGEEEDEEEEAPLLALEAILDDDGGQRREDGAVLEPLAGQALAVYTYTLRCVANPICGGLWKVEKERVSGLRSILGARFRKVRKRRGRMSIYEKLSTSGASDSGSPRSRRSISFSQTPASVGRSSSLGLCDAAVASVGSVADSPTGPVPGDVDFESATDVFLLRYLQRVFRVPHSQHEQLLAEARLLGKAHVLDELQKRLSHVDRHPLYDRANFGSHEGYLDWRNEESTHLYSLMAHVQNEEDPLPPPKSSDRSVAGVLCLRVVEAASDREAEELDRAQVVVHELWENERRTFRSAYSRHNLHAKGDFAPFTSADGERAFDSLAAYRPPWITDEEDEAAREREEDAVAVPMTPGRAQARWKRRDEDAPSPSRTRQVREVDDDEVDWVGEWEVDMRRHVDPDGWEYALNWFSTFRPTSESERGIHFVRRRRWTRAARPSAQQAQAMEASSALAMRPAASSVAYARFARLAYRRTIFQTQVVTSDRANRWGEMFPLTITEPVKKKKKRREKGERDEAVRIQIINLESGRGAGDKGKGDKGKGERPAFGEQLLGEVYFDVPLADSSGETVELWVPLSGGAWGSGRVLLQYSFSPIPAVDQQEPLEPHHFLATYLMAECLKFDRSNDRKQLAITTGDVPGIDPEPRTGLSMAARCLLSEYGMRYGVSEVYQCIAYLELLTGKLSTDLVQILEISKTLQRLLELSTTKDGEVVVPLTKFEEDTLHRIIVDTEAWLRRVIMDYADVFPLNGRDSHLSDTGRSLSTCLRIYSLLAETDAFSHQYTEYESFDDLIGDILVAGMTNRYEQLATEARRDRTMSSLVVLCEELVDVIKRDDAHYRRIFLSAVQLDLLSLTARAFHGLFVLDLFDIIANNSNHNSTGTPIKFVSADDNASESGSVVGGSSPAASPARKKKIKKGKKDVAKTQPAVLPPPPPPPPPQSGTAEDASEVLRVYYQLETMNAVLSKCLSSFKAIPIATLFHPWVERSLDATAAKLRNWVERAVSGDPHLSEANADDAPLLILPSHSSSTRDICDALSQAIDFVTNLNWPVTSKEGASVLWDESREAIVERMVGIVGETLHDFYERMEDVFDTELAACSRVMDRVHKALRKKEGILAPEDVAKVQAKAAKDEAKTERTTVVADLYASSTSAYQSSIYQSNVFNSSSTLPPAMSTEYEEEPEVKHPAAVPLPDRLCLVLNNLFIMKSHVVDMAKLLYGDGEMDEEHMQGMMQLEDSLNARLHAMLKRVCEVVMAPFVRRCLLAYREQARDAADMSDYYQLEIVDSYCIDTSELTDFLDAHLVELQDNLYADFFAEDLLPRMWQMVCAEFEWLLVYIESPKRLPHRNECKLIARMLPRVRSFFHGDGDGLSSRSLDVFTDDLHHVATIAKAPTAILVHMWKAIGGGIEDGTETPGEIAPRHIMAVLNGRRHVDPVAAAALKE